MSLRLEMLQVARLAPNLLHDAADRVTDYLRDQFNEDGGARDRTGQSDLYYTVFALEGLRALRADLPVERTIGYLKRFGNGADLDLVHLTCLARCWADLPENSLDPTFRRAILERVESYRTSDGGYAPRLGAQDGTIYHSFLAQGAYQDLAGELPHVDRLLECVRARRTADGAYADARRSACGVTTVTAAAVTLMRQLGESVDSFTGEWLLARAHRDGGFVAAPMVPAPDLLSTATALHALVGMHVGLDDLKERCLDFIDSLWTGKAFCGHWADDIHDSEYTYYGLLSLGHLSL